ncbi:4-hydroxy-tetrahydrodipicolinate synthase [bacterium]|nr:4-hydroxy-tetrahydrodipicolinate synthase [bacterium]
MNPTGVYTALVTPFKNGKVDEKSLINLVQQQMKNGVKKFVVNGTTAESPTLSQEESLELLKLVTKTAGPEATIMFGSGSNNTRKTIDFSLKAMESGAKSLLVVVPYYNKPPQQGLYEHFKTIADAVSVPVLLYNVPGRTITSLELDTIQKLSKIKNIVGIKEATGNVEFGKQIINSCEKSWSVLSGDDETCLDLQKAGGKGVISVCSHIMPQKMSQWFAGAVDQNDLEDFYGARELIRSLYITSNPIPVKAALQILGIIEQDEMRLPLCRLTAEQKKQLEMALKKYEKYL